MQCIICREDKNDMSDEHVIPDSLGGFYHIYNVCKTCNSILGEKVDAPLVNHKLTELYRFSEKIEGKSGKVPNPFSGIFIESGNPEVKARVDVNDEGMLDVIYHPVVSLKDDAGIIQSIEITVDKKNENEIEKILHKIIKRNGIPESSVIRGERRIEKRIGGVEGSWKVDCLKFQIGLLKIAYEFAVDSIPSFLSDSAAIAISKILKTHDYEGVNEYVKIYPSPKPEIFANLIDYLDFSSKKHYLVLMPSKCGLLCLIKLHNLFSSGVILSTSNYINSTEGIIGINDIDGKNFRKLLLSDLIAECLGPLHTRFAYHFNDEHEKNIGFLEINSPSYRYEGNDCSEIPLYKMNGEKHPLLVHELLETCHCNRSVKDNLTVTLFEFDKSECYYLKSVGTGNLHRVIAFEMSQVQIKKI